jgi:hypothetical protein
MSRVFRNSCSKSELDLEQGTEYGSSLLSQADGRSS